MTDTIPPAVRIAAKRGFLRGLASGYKATLSAGLPSAAVIVAVFTDPQGFLLAGLTVTLALFTPVIAGLTRYFGVLEYGIPDDYIDAAVDKRIQEGR